MVFDTSFVGAANTINTHYHSQKPLITLVR